MSDTGEAQVREWERLAEKAWPGPWTGDDVGVKDAAGETVALVYAKDGREKRWWWECENDTRDFIVAAREAVPALAKALRDSNAIAQRFQAESERAREALRRLLKAMGCGCCSSDDYEAAIAEAEALAASPAQDTNAGREG